MLKKPMPNAAGYDVLMKDRARKRGVSKGQWLESALEVLCLGSISDVKIDVLAKSLGVSRSGFYWHFKNREELLAELLDYWTHETTEVITENPDFIRLNPGERLRQIAKTIHDYDLVRHEIGIRQWALSSKKAAKAVAAVNKVRMGFASNALKEFGFSGDDLEMRAMLFICYQAFESTVFREIPANRRRELIDKRVDLITSQ